MGISKYIGRVGALAVALGVGFATVYTSPVSLAEPANSGTNPPDRPDRVALIMGGGTLDTPDQYLVDIIKNHYIEPTHPDDENIQYVPVTTRMEAWPITGLARFIGTVLGPPEVWGPGGAGWWPDAPLWKLSGLFDLTVDQAVQAGVSNLKQAMADHPNVPLVVYGISEGSLIANAELRKLAQQYPTGTDAPDIDFVIQGTFNLPNGGLHARFPGSGLPIGWSFDGPAPTDTQFDTVMVNRQYDGVGDFPLYPINLISSLNAFLGIQYVHLYAFDDSLPTPDPTKSPAYQGAYGRTSYYLFETEDLPLFGPLRTLGVPESVIDVFEPFFRVIVELGYDRSIPPWEPTPARLFPVIDPVKLSVDLLDAIGEGINNALSLVGMRPQQHIPAEYTDETAQKVVSDQVSVGQQVTADEDRAEAQQQQVTADEDRAEAQQQVTADEDRAEAQQQQVTADEDRAEAQQQQVTADEDRAEAEQEQVTADEGRVKAEQQTADEDRAKPGRQQQTADRDRVKLGRQQQTADRDRAKPGRPQQTADRDRAKPGRQQQTADRDRAKPGRQQQTSDDDQAA